MNKVLPAHERRHLLPKELPNAVNYLSDEELDFERYRVQEWLNFVTSELHKTFGPIFRPTTPDAFKALSKENLGKRFDWLDKQLAGKGLPDGATSSLSPTPICSRCCAGPRVSTLTSPSGRTSRPMSIGSPRVPRCRRR